LEGFGIRINKKPPNIVFKKKDKGGIAITATQPNEVASLGHRNNLSTTTLAIFGTFDNSWKIENLNLGTIV
jgi:hypothetical protein